MSSFRRLLSDIKISISWWIIPDIVPVQYRKWTNIMFTIVRKKLLNGQLLSFPWNHSIFKHILFGLSFHILIWAKASSQPIEG